MHALSIVAGSADVIIHVFIEDTRLGNGGGLTELAYNTSGLSAYYMIPGDAGETVISLANTTLGSHTDGGFLEVDATNMPGWYELQLPDDCIAAGFKTCALQLKGAANMAVTNVLITQASEGATAADISNAVWDAAHADHKSDGSIGRAIADIKKISVCRLNSTAANTPPRI